MLDRVNMTCPKCGSTKRLILSVVSDPVLSDEEKLLNHNEHVLMCSTCADCSFFQTGWVHVRPLVNLIRAAFRSGSSTLRDGLDTVSMLYAYVKCPLGPWLAKHKTSKADRLVLCEETKVFMTQFLPDVYAWFNREPRYMLLASLPYSRVAHRDYIEEKMSLQKDVWAVAIAVLRNRNDGDDVPTIDITNAIRMAYGQPLAS